VLEGKEYWWDVESDPAVRAISTAHLLPNFDEYTVAYRDRAAVHGDGPFDPSLFSFGSVLSNVVTISGRVRGAWRKANARGELQLELRLLGRMPPAEMAAVEAAGQKMGRFLERPVQLVWP
jgi:hypothetical protein